MPLPAWLARRPPAAAAGAAADPEAPAPAAADGSSNAPKTKAAALRGAYDIDDHQLSLEQLAKRYPESGIDPSDPAASRGLTEAAALLLRQRHGANRLTPPKDVPEFFKFLRQLANPLLLMLLVAGGLTYMAYAIQSPRDRTNLILASALVAVVLLTALMSYWQERSASNVMASLGKMMPAQCTVVRQQQQAAGGSGSASAAASNSGGGFGAAGGNGGGFGGGGGGGKSGGGGGNGGGRPLFAERRVDASELVPGDIVRLGLGDRVPADVRIIHTQDLKMEMSSLTGESDLVSATVDARHPLPAEARNVAFASSLVMQGGATGVVVRTGDHTMIGQIASLATQTTGERSTLEREVHRLVVFVAVLAACVAVVLFVIGLAQRRISPLTAFVNGFILVIVANVPEGLPATVTSLLSLTALRLKERNVLIKRTTIIESLGSATIIASDKTGTLTQNRMTVESVWLGGELRAAAALRPPPEAPAASLERASFLARRSVLARQSRALGRVSRASRPPQAASAALAAQYGGQQHQQHDKLQPIHSFGPAELPVGVGSGSSAAGGGALSSAAPSSTAPWLVVGAGAGAGVGLSPPSAADDALRRRSSGLSRMSRDPASAMAAGRTFRPRGDGTFEILARPSVSAGGGGAGAAGAAASGAAAGAAGAAAAPVLPFSVQSFAEPDSVVWDRCSMLTKLVTIATVCNKAKFAPVPAAGGAGAGGAAATAPGAPSFTSAPSAGAGGPSRSPSSFLAARRAAALPASAAASAAAANPDDRPALGDATDCGLLRYGDRLAPAALLRAAYKKVFDIPFNSTNKFALVACECAGSPGEHLLLLKGAPEIVVTKCSLHLAQQQQQQQGGSAAAAGGAAAGGGAAGGGGGGVELPIDDAFTSAMNAAYERCGSLGERVIGFAYARVPARSAADYHADAEAADAAKAAAAKAAADGDSAAAAAALASAPRPLYDSAAFVFAGLVSLVDPPRDGVLESVLTCRSAGVRVAMVTGDHALTAEAIARKVGIVTLATAREVAAEDGLPGGAEDVALDDPRVGAAVVTGQMIRDRGGDQDWWDGVITKPELVFARTSPQQKLQIVEHLQRLGEVVAVTGDGVNDAPALKRAQIGVSMGKGGSDVAREAADIVLMDDDFSSVVAAIAEGRTVFDNLTKTCAYTLAHAVPEVFPLFLNLALNMPVGLGGLLILSIDLITEQGPAISLAYEPQEDNVMRRPPRDLATDRLISGALLRHAYLVVGVAEAAACMLSFFAVFWWRGVPLSRVFDSVPTYWGVEPVSGPLRLCPPAAPAASATGAFAGDADGACRVLSGEQQRQVYFEAQAAWYACLVCCQFFHVWTCKTRRAPLWRHGPMRNAVTAWGCAVAVFVMLVVVFVPFLQPVFQTAPVPGVAWLPAVGFGAWVFLYTEASKRRARERPDGWWARKMAW